MKQIKGNKYTGINGQADRQKHSHTDKQMGSKFVEERVGV